MRLPEFKNVFLVCSSAFLRAFVVGALAPKFVVDALAPTKLVGVV